MGDKIREQQRNQRPRAPRRLRARAPSARGASSSRRPPQRCGDVEAVIRRRGFADFVDVDAVVTDKNGPQHGLLFLVTDRASGCRLASRWGLGGGLRFLDLAFEPGDLHLKAALTACSSSTRTRKRSASPALAGSMSSRAVLLLSAGAFFGLLADRCRDNGVQARHGPTTGREPQRPCEPSDRRE